MTPRGTYLKIADDLRRQIVDGELGGGAMLPSEHTLVAVYGVSRGTVRSALSLLKNEGLVESVPGQGRRVVGPSSEGAQRTAYERIAAELLRRMDTGEFASGEPLPSEADLIAAYGVSRNTARRAYRALVEAGAVVVRPGAGAFPAAR